MQPILKRFLLSMMMMLLHNLSAQKPVLIKDGSSEQLKMQQLTGCNGLLFFSGLHNPDQLYRSDGTPAGTYMVKEITDHTIWNNAGFPVNLTAVGNLLFFDQYDGYSNVKKLWITDGTEAGTRIVKEMNLDTWQGMWTRTVFKNQLFFVISTVEYGNELWRSDGTDAGTRLVKDIYPGTEDASPMNFMTLNDELYFFATDAEHGTELWKTDGTEQGTVLVKDIYPGTGSSAIYEGKTTTSAALDGFLYFTANDGAHGKEPWRSNGTPEGTVLVKDVNPGKESSLPSEYTAHAGAVYFSAASTSYTTMAQFGNYTITVYNSELHRTDGTGPGTFMVKDINQNPAGSGVGNLTLCNGRLLFYGMGGLYTSDGTDQGTVVLKNTQPVPASPYGFVKAGNSIYFAASTSGNYGSELWKTDGFANGTQRVCVLEPGPGSSYMSQLTVVGSGLYFTSHPYNYKLWKLDISGDLFTDEDTPVKIFPNPFSGQIGIYFFERPAGFIRVDVYDLAGHKVYRGEFAPDQHINITELSELAAGAYLLDLTYDHQKLSRKLIKLD